VQEAEQTLKVNFIETIKDPDKIQNLAFDLIESARENILGIFSTCNAFHRQERAGVFSLLKVVTSSHNVKVRILSPFDEKIELMAQLLKDEAGIEVRPIEQASQTKVSVLLVDRKFSLIVELKDDAMESSLEAIGLATYSNSPATVLSYVSIFESLWRQSELYEKLKIHDKLQNEFISMAAHEMRTPIQPVLALSQHLLAHDTSIDFKERQHFLEIIVRNAVRLQHLTEDILDITKIETHSLQLKMEPIDVKQVILKSIQDAQDQLDEKKIKLQFTSSQTNMEANLVKADRRRLAQVMANLLNNSIKFTPKGEIHVMVKREAEFVLVQIRDTGSGIDPEVMGNLFSKFVSKSVTGTGLGLYISKGIVEAHGGNIRAENNSDSKGASFTFSLPVINQGSNSSSSYDTREVS
jgi:two-component system, OmpR family, sensor histidine kinase VicK